MKDFTFNVPQDIIFGKGSLKRLPELLEKSGSKKMLLISGPVLKKIGMVEKVEEIVKASGIEVEVFTDVEANPSVATVDKATEAYKKVIQSLSNNLQKPPQANPAPIATR